MKKIFKKMLNAYVVLGIGITGVALTAIDNTACLFAGSVMLGYVGAVVVTMVAFAWVINPISRMRKRKKGIQ